jgi:hypothetical protein
MFGSRGWVAQDAEEALAHGEVETDHLRGHHDRGAMGPAQVQFEPGDPGDPRIGADPLSVVELAADVRRVESEQIQIEAST